MSTLILYCPKFRMTEREYTARVVFNEYLGLEVRTAAYANDSWLLTDPDGKCCLHMPDSFFSKARINWLSPKSLPQRPLPVWKAESDLSSVLLIQPELPIIAGQKNEDKSWFSLSGTNSARLGIDVFGAIFFMLTCYEEVVKPDLDEHGRFPAVASLAYQENFLLRPIVDEYIEVLWTAMKQLWPVLQRRKSDHRLELTHDVDWPFAVKGEPCKRILRRIGGDLIRRRNPGMAARRIGALLLAGKIGDRLDPNNTFDWIMDQSERNGLQSEFYFMAGGTAKYDSGYDLFSPRIQRLLSHIHARGHIIGFHPSYRTLARPDLLVSEADRLQRALEKARVPQKAKCGRQHFLRWQAGRTWDDWAYAGLEEDSSVGFADHIGFRAGTCHRYPTWSLISGRPLAVLERPLIATEGSLLSPKYMGLDEIQSFALLKQLSAAIKMVGGNLVLLWHNDSFIRTPETHIYERILAERL